MAVYQLGTKLMPRSWYEKLLQTLCKPQIKISRVGDFTGQKLGRGRETGNPGIFSFVLANVHEKYIYSLS
jgi:hypothetical protein